MRTNNLPPLTYQVANTRTPISKNKTKPEQNNNLTFTKSPHPSFPRHTHTHQHINMSTSASTTSTNNEPPSGLRGSGTPSSPYDGGNAPENDVTSSSSSDPSATTSTTATSETSTSESKSKSGEEPPNAQKGAGTAEEPYDGGNQDA